MQYMKKAVGWFECNDGGIGFSHEMSVRRVDVIVCVNCENRKVV